MATSEASHGREAHTVMTPTITPLRD